jgi:hypothetical protein
MTGSELKEINASYFAESLTEAIGGKNAGGPRLSGRASRVRAVIITTLVSGRCPRRAGEADVGFGSGI